MKKTRKVRKSKKGGSRKQNVNNYKNLLILPPGHFAILYDPDASVGTYLHWLQDYTRVYVTYQGPSPPKGTGVHRYIFMIVQGSPLTVPMTREAVDINVPSNT